MFSQNYFLFNENKIAYIINFTRLTIEPKMRTQAYFENISEQISNELSRAKNSITIAVAWFTDISLFEMLCSKASQEVAVELLLMSDEINNKSGINYSRLVNSGGKVWLFKDKEGHETLMHNKFCVIDGNTIINGSYNWTNKAKYNHESITVINEDEDLAAEFLREFQNLKVRYFGTETEQVLIDFGKVCIRLESLKNAILLKDLDEIDYHLQKITRQLAPETDNPQVTTLYKIVCLCNHSSYGEAVELINEFTQRFKAITVYVDSEVEALRLELKALELQINALEDEKTEIEKLLHEFDVRYSHELGDLILKVLQKRKEKLKVQAEQDNKKYTDYEDAAKDYEQYRQTNEITKSKKVAELTPEQRNEIKTLFRKASKLCHPDVVSEEWKKKAELIFNELRTAYEANDIEAVEKILHHLEQGMFVHQSQQQNAKKELQTLTATMREKRDKLEQEVNQLKADKSYQTVQAITNWDAYFEETRQMLETELKNYK
jgi:hypothetical protein